VADPSFLLDSNICIYILGGQYARLRTRVESLGLNQAVTSAIVYAEVMRGIDPKDAAQWDGARALFTLFPPQPFDQNAADIYRSIPFKRGSFDRLIAAHALALGVTLVTNNLADFSDVPGLKVEDWTI
jgi:tRNA(fMet)-specific endonuclease VapC